MDITITRKPEVVAHVSDMRPGEFAETASGKPSLLYCTKENKIVNLSHDGSVWIHENYIYRDVAVRLFKPGEKIEITI